VKNLNNYITFYVIKLHDFYALGGIVLKEAASRISGFGILFSTRGIDKE